MKLVQGQRWRCENPECGGEIEVITSSRVDGANPRCACGAVMKRPYTKPTAKLDEAGGAAQNHS
jgi:hypothetical protein